MYRSIYETEAMAWFLALCEVNWQMVGVFLLMNGRCFIKYSVPDEAKRGSTRGVRRCQRLQPYGHGAFQDRNLH